MKHASSRRTVFLIVILYVCVALYLNVQAACFGVAPDGAGSLVCGFEYFAVLKWLLMPSFLLLYVLSWLGLSGYFPSDFYLMIPLIGINALVLYFLLTSILSWVKANM